MYDEDENIIYLESYCPSPSIIEEDEFPYGNSYARADDDFSLSNNSQWVHPNRASDWFLSQSAGLNLQSSESCPRRNFQDGDSSISD